jgi:hypothetical protein
VVGVNHFNLFYQAAVPEWEEEPVKDTESKAHYKDLHAKRPICNKIADTLKVKIGLKTNYKYMGGIGLRTHYKDLHNKRPICNKTADTLKVTNRVKDQLQGPG